MQSSPAVAERTGDRAADRPDQPLGRRSRVASLGRRKLAADARVLGGQRIRLRDQNLLLLARRCELALLLLALARERSLTREELILRVTLLLGPHGDDLRLGMHAGSDRLGALAGEVDLVARAGNLGGDAFVLSC